MEKVIGVERERGNLLGWARRPPWLHDVDGWMEEEELWYVLKRNRRELTVGQPQ
jgi:hypothetical protein